MKKIFYAIILAAISLLVMSCTGKSEKTNSSKSELVIYCPHPLDFINPLIKEFEKQNPDIKVDVIAAGTGELLKRIESEQNNPLGDILWGGA